MFGKKKNKMEYEIELSPEIYDDNAILHTETGHTLMDKLNECETILDVLELLGLIYMGPNCNTVGELMERDKDNVLYEAFIETFINIGANKHLKKSPLMSIKDRIFKKSVDYIREKKDYVAGYVLIDKNDFSAGYNENRLNVITYRFMINDSIKNLRLDMFIEYLISIGENFAEKFVRYFVDSIEDYSKFRCVGKTVKECINAVINYNINTIILSKSMFNELITDTTISYNTKKNRVILPNGVNIYSSNKKESVKAYAFNSNNVSIMTGDYIVIQPTKNKYEKLKEYEIIGYISKPFIDGDVCIVM